MDERLAISPGQHAARTDHEQRQLRRLIDATNQQIDHLVYELYDLTQEEIDIVEGEAG